MLWSVLLAAAFANALAMQLHADNRVGSNLVHYYLGARYPIPYPDLYRAYQAALEEPQVSMRDLEHPERIVRASDTEQRAYFLGLLRAHGVPPGEPLDPLAPTAVLAERARASGAIAAEADTILARVLPAGRIAAFRRDVRASVALLRGRPFIQDYGYNGSPFYSLVRSADPALHLPLGALTGVWNLASQLVATGLLAAIAGKAFGLPLTDQLAIATLLLASWDFVAYAMSGLVFGELWLPLACFGWASRRRLALPAGFALAWVGLLKLFPFALAAPLLVRSLAPASSAPTGTEAGSRGWARVAFTAALVSAGLFALAAPISGRSWGEFTGKILGQFQSGSLVSVNSVSLSAFLGCVGVPVHSVVTTVLGAGFLAALVWLVSGEGREGFVAAMPRRAFVVMAATGWWTRNWFNYYAFVPLLVLMPVLASRGRRWGAAISVLGLGLSFALPDFDDPALLEQPLLHAIKLLPYVAIPVWMAAGERPRVLPAWLRGVWPRRVVVAAGVALVGAFSFEVWRASEISRLAGAAEQCTRAGDSAGALALQDRLLRIVPGDARVHASRGISLGTLGRLDEARAAFAEASRLAPDDAASLDNLGRTLFMLGRLDEAAAAIESASRLGPADPSIAVGLARVRLGQGRRDEALSLLERARELAPEDDGLAALLGEVKGSGR
ncbi:MAG: tetratricopeptide repeat protein [Candidatus Eisenbacteria bacterium]